MCVLLFLFVKKAKVKPAFRLVMHHWKPQTPTHQDKLWYMAVINCSRVKPEPEPEHTHTLTWCVRTETWEGRLEKKGRHRRKKEMIDWWMPRRIKGKKGERKDGWMDGRQKLRIIDGFMKEWKEGSKEGRNEGLTEGWTKSRKERIDGWMDGWNR